MANFNKVILAGTLVKDPEIRYTGAGTAVCNFRIAVNPNKKDAKPEDTLFINIVTWEKKAETANAYLKKAARVLVEGKLVVRSYEKDGQKKQSVEVQASDFQMLDRKSSNGVTEPPAQAAIEVGADAGDEAIEFT